MDYEAIHLSNQQRHARSGLAPDQLLLFYDALVAFYRTLYAPENLLEPRLNAGSTAIVLRTVMSTNTKRSRTPDAPKYNSSNLRVPSKN